jgi:predicted MPP superfamily phosphohydrolase
MKKIIHLSDIHYRSDWMENQGVVLDALFRDIEGQIKTDNKKNVYVVFSGDVVLRGERCEQYDEFIGVFGERLDALGIGIGNRICVPGNHDVSRKDVVENKVEHNGVLTQLDNEKLFNDYASKSGNLFQAKFKNYGVFEKRFAKFGVVNDLFCGAGHVLDGELAVYCLNTSIASRADSALDKNNLMINTRKINEWLSENDSVCRVLVMHHPVEWLNDWSKKELNRLINHGFDLCLSGHGHEQSVYHSRSTGDRGDVVACSAPALFTSKENELGYAVINIKDNGCVESVAYRQWSNRSNFVKGVSFTENDDGVFYIGKDGGSGNRCVIRKDSSGTVANNIFAKRLEGALQSFSSQPTVWVEPLVMPHSEDKNNDAEGEPVDLDSFVDEPKSLLIQSPPQFGQTCLALYLAECAWKKNKFWLYLDAKTLKLHTIDREVDRELEIFGLDESRINCVIVDSWVAHDSGAEKVVKKIIKKFKNIPVVLMQSVDDLRIMSENLQLDVDKVFDRAYLWSLSRDKVRKIVSDYNDRRHVGDEEVVLKKVVSDMSVLNMHRTPLNCLTLLKVSEVKFDDSPVNRTEIIKRVLFLLFNVDDIPTYKSRPDLKDCEYVLGKFCEKLIRVRRAKFSRKEFIDDLNRFCSERVLALDVAVVFDVLYLNNIVVACGNEFAFKFSYWVYYFAAQRMHQDKAFAKYILEDMNYSSFPEVIEFYTGIDRSRDDALKTLVNDIRVTRETVEKRCGLPVEMNPYRFGRWKPTEETIVEMENEIKDGVQKSKLPSSVKDTYADRGYNRVLPYNQELADFLTDYSLATLMQIVKAGSRALRNSDYVDPELKRELLAEISASWEQISKVILVISPILAEKKIAMYDGAGFALSGSFGDTREERFNRIITNIPYNIVDWYKDDVFSSKMSPLLMEHFGNISDEQAKHRFSLLLILTRPAGWRRKIEQYIEEISKNSFYLFDAFRLLRSEYRYSFSSTSELKDIEYVMKMALAKHETGSKKPGKKMIDRMSDKVLPERRE